MKMHKSQTYLNSVHILRLLRIMKYIIKKHTIPGYQHTYTAFYQTYYCSRSSKDLDKKLSAVSCHNLSLGDRKEMAGSISDYVCLVEAFILCCYSVLVRRHSDLCREHSRRAGHREFCCPESYRTARCVSLFSPGTYHCSSAYTSAR